MWKIEVDINNPVLGRIAAQHGPSIVCFLLVEGIIELVPIVNGVGYESYTFKDVSLKNYKCDPEHWRKGDHNERCIFARSHYADDSQTFTLRDALIDCGYDVVD